MKKFGSIFFCVVFFAIIIAPTTLMPWTQNKRAENRLPAPPPELIKEGKLNLSLPDETEAYFDDNFAGRTKMIDAYSRVIGSVFGVSANDKVIMGRDGWLFFQETAGDFDGSAAISDSEMEKLIQELLEFKKSAQLRGQVLLIAVAPNKNTIYGEFMPYGYKQTGNPTNFERLMAAEGLDIIDLRPVLLSAGRTTYYKTDTHWNSLGARFAAREIMLAIEKNTGAGAGFDWESGTSGTDRIIGDLAQMLYPEKPPEESDFIFSDTEQNYSTVGRYRSPDDLHITTKSDGTPLRVVMYRDSFANALIPYFSNAYSDVYYTRQTPLPMDSEVVLEADVIVLEIAERRLGEIIGITQDMP